MPATFSQAVPIGLALESAGFLGHGHLVRNGMGTKRLRLTYEIVRAGEAAGLSCVLRLWDSHCSSMASMGEFKEIASFANRFISEPSRNAETVSVIRFV